MTFTQSLFDEGAPEPAPERFNAARYCVAGADVDPEKPALLVLSEAEGAPRIWTRREIADRVMRVAAGLKARGLRPGDRVMLRLGHEPAFPLLFFGTIAAGGVALPTSAQLAPEEARFIAEDAGARFVAESAALSVETSGELLDEAAIAGLIDHPERAAFADTAADDPAYLIYTSGSTDRPKGVLHAHRAVWARRMMWEGWYGLRPDDRMLHAGAFNWTYTLGAGLMDPWAIVATAIIYDGPRDPAVWPRIARAQGATIFAAVPGVYRQLLKYGEDLEEGFATLRHGLTAGEKLPGELREAWTLATGKPLYEALGMSECSTFISSSPSAPVREGFSGRPQRGRRIALLPQDGGEKPVAIGDTGVIAIDRRDPGLMLRYWNRPEEEAASMRGRWFLTGDLGEMDEDGYVAYRGRADDLMNAMGYRVSPQEVEDVLSAHPAVAECAVAEMTVRADLSIVAGFVVPSVDVGANALIAHCAEHLAAYKTPREIVFVETLPRSANGKIRRKDLAAAHSRA